MPSWSVATFPWFKSERWEFMSGILKQWCTLLGSFEAPHSFPPFRQGFMSLKRSLSYTTCQMNCGLPLKIFGRETEGSYAPLYHCCLSLDKRHLTENRLYHLLAIDAGMSYPASRKFSAEHQRILLVQNVVAFPSTWHYQGGTITIVEWPFSAVGHSFSSFFKQIGSNWPRVRKFIP
jgi:hypothetical protein